MKLNFGTLRRSQPDPFIFEDDGKYYLYVTAGKGTEAYSADDPFGEWKFEGVVFSVGTHHSYWACALGCGAGTAEPSSHKC